jgi:hypothetical protein
MAPSQVPALPCPMLDKRADAVYEMHTFLLNPGSTAQVL